MLASARRCTKLTRDRREGVHDLVTLVGVCVSPSRSSGEASKEGMLRALLPCACLCNIATLASALRVLISALGAMGMHLQKR